MIEVIPAIDIMDSKCVRLTQGKYNQKTIYSDNPVQMAKEFENKGFKRLHLVDLDGAKSGKPENLNILKDICSSTKLIVDYSGGLRNESQVESAINSGAQFIAIGSLAVKEPDTFRKMIQIFDQEKFILVADVLDNQVYVNGWTKATNILITDLINDYYDLGIRNFMCTDISKDGMLSGTNTGFYKKLKAEFNDAYIIASGGVSSKKDIKELDQVGIDAVVVGKAFYENII
jgi:phosphoribosylformimino-5-aminoimidazole carboxamide ribotide isomerase